MKALYLTLPLIVLAAGVQPAAADGDAALGDNGPNEPSSTSSGRLTETVTFESLNLPPGSQVDPSEGVAMTVEGFTFTPGPNNASGFNDSHYGNAVTFWPYNGTHVMLHHDDVVIRREDSSTFQLLSFDFAGFPQGGEITVTVTGEPGGLVAAFTPDGLVDGQGGATDFQTFLLPGTFEDLTSVTFEHSGGGTISGLFGLDNIMTGESVSVDAQSWGQVKGQYQK